MRTLLLLTLGFGAGYAFTVSEDQTVAVIIFSIFLYFLFFGLSGSRGPSGSRDSRNKRSDSTYKYSSNAKSRKAKNVKNNDIWSFSKEETSTGIKRRRMKLPTPGSFLTATKRSTGILSFTRSQRLPGQRVETLNMKTGKKTTRQYSGGKTMRGLGLGSKLLRTKKPITSRKPKLHKVKKYSPLKRRK